MQNKYDILRLKSNPYPVHGDLTKVINYQDTRNIFLSKKEGGKMEASIDMNNNTIYNVKDPVQADQATNKKYVDNQLAKKLDKGANIDMKNKSISILIFHQTKETLHVSSLLTTDLVKHKKNILNLMAQKVCLET